MSLRSIQAQLCELYDLDLDLDVEDFLFEEPEVSALQAEGQRGSDGPGWTERGEVLLLREDEEGLLVGLYVCPEARRALQAGGDLWSDDRFEQASLATEGVSHFLYVALRADAGRSVSALELELQAEVDKYATATLPSDPHLLRGFGAGVIQERSRRARRALFSAPRFLDAADSEEGQRYRAAHARAARFARHLEDEYLARGDLDGFVLALRRFFGSGLQEMLDATR